MKQVDTVQGPMWVWDWEKYQDAWDYCPGNDDVSMTLDLYGVWESPDWVRWRQVLDAEPGRVYDFGAHVGWYSIAALQRGHQVGAIDQDPDNIRLLALNTRGMDIAILESAVSKMSTLHPVSLVPSLAAVKSDVEGAEDEVMRIIRHLLPGPTLLLECSPEFANYYPALIDELRGMGYTASVEGVGEITGADLERQANVWFV